MLKLKNVKILGIVLSVAVLIFGIPIIINECYKVNAGYSTVWDASAVIGYYGTILGAIITVTTLVATISFTKKQIQRESFLKNESEKWSELKSIFLEILGNINPMVMLKDVIDNGFVDPDKAVIILQKYQIDCKTATDLLSAYLNIVDYPKVKQLIDGINDITGELVRISEGEINQYSDLRIFQNKDSWFQIVEIEKSCPGSFTKENLAKNQENIEKLKNISFENINLQIAHLNSEFVNVYEAKYRALLQLTGSTFEMIVLETQRQADQLLNFGVIHNPALRRTRKKKGRKNGSN